MDNLSTITKGRLGYNIAENFLLKNNFDVYTPILENTKIDCIAVKDDKLFRIQIKTIQTFRGSRFLPVRKLSNNRNSNKQKHYTDKDIDFFFGVDLETSDIYIVPISFIMMYQSAISLKHLQEYKNNIDILK